MKIEAVTISGFRGFKQEQTINFHPALTLIYGQNSYGKTSMTEAVEWLLYGKTSKVDKGESKEEYKGSYRNCHLDEADTVRLQYAEEEVRLIITDLTSSLYSKKKNVHKDANRLNSSHVRKCLVECGLPAKLVDHITQTFETTDDSHHVTNYTPARDRIRPYHGYATELAKCL